MTNNNHTFANTNLVAVPTELMLDPRLTLDAKGAAVCIYEDDTHLQNFNLAKLAQQIGITKLELTNVLLELINSGYLFHYDGHFVLKYPRILVR